MSTRYKSVCVLGHRRTHQGPFASWRNDRWWRRHDHPAVAQAFSTYDAWSNGWVEVRRHGGGLEIRSADRPPA